MPDLSSMEATGMSEDKEEEDGARDDNVRCALNGETQDSTNETPCRALVPYRRRTCFELSWKADSSWSLRMLRLMIECARLKMLMAWYSTLGGAHSSLGEISVYHAEHAGAISGCQLSLAVNLRDPLLATRCKLYFAYSLLQQGKLQQANKIIREQYQYITEEATVEDLKLMTMCLAAWERLCQLKRFKKAKHSQRTVSLRHSQEDHT